MPPQDGDLNVQIASRFREAAELLKVQGANPFRVNAYHRAADTLTALGEPVSEILRRDGIEGLIALPGIGRSLAAAIDEISATGRWTQLDRLRGVAGADALFRTIPGVGPEIARRIHETLGVETLEDLEVAVNDGRIEKIQGIGNRRARMIRASLASMLQRRRRVPQGTDSPNVSVGLVLNVDREYREQAQAGRLRKIAPRRFNPDGEAWLPILHAQRGDWHFTVLYSNTAQAHRLGKTSDWVVMYFHTDDEPERQCTVVTETRGELARKRVVRGREQECRTYYVELA
jgi:hypothetical protein